MDYPLRAPTVWEAVDARKTITIIVLYYVLYYYIARGNIGTINGIRSKNTSNEHTSKHSINNVYDDGVQYYNITIESRESRAAAFRMSFYSKSFYDFKHRDPRDWRGDSTWKQLIFKVTNRTSPYRSLFPASVLTDTIVRRL